MTRKQQTKLAGRPHGLNRQRAQTICRAFALGAFRETAADLAGISACTLRSWLSRGRAELERIETGKKPRAAEEPFLDLAMRAMQSEAKAEKRLLDVVKTASHDGDWRAAAWHLERRWPERWSQRVNIVIEQELDAFMAVLERELDGETFERVMSAADRAVRREDGEL